MLAIKRQLLVSVLLLGAAVGISVLLFLGRPPAEIAEPVVRPVSVDVAVAVAENIRVEIQAQGTVEALRRTALLAEVSGRVVETSDKFLVGGFVAADEVLLRIDPRDYQTELLRAQAAVETAESALAQEKGRAEVALAEWEKLPANSQRNQEARDLYLRKPQLEQAQAQLRAATADLNTARDRLERTIIRAPYDAVIASRDTELGQYVVTGARLAEVFSVDYAEVRLPVAQSRLAFLELPGLGKFASDTPIDLYTAAGGQVRHWEATLHRTEGVFDERSRSLYVVARIADPYALHSADAEPLRMGSFVNAAITGREITDVIALPRYVLRAGNQLWVVGANDILQDRAVSVLSTGGEFALIDAGLLPGERVSLTLLDESLEGAKVVINSTTPTDELRRREQRALPGDATAALAP
ncbi:efflux RND transporter periplasmic adaptor subunit [Mangrovimicrobium sediminis]|uniref:Efflux RND transporter periplasmic adaptor subunit n=1 Tax=Mangrovimicrobium sediminis TaxID=2562682 RepID=A0A4Z0LYA7_9GAMM|nr:efflux RND transporter periplasmic adaptor subunit [Haliea sp. SAOS-164]TGD72065.1 efflux RND transporter periplasmic adaptor subunit [Haliea sp. SAOS-164]